MRSAGTRSIWPRWLRSITIAAAGVILLILVPVAVVAWNPFLLLEGTLGVTLRLQGVRQQSLQIGGRKIAYLEKTPVSTSAPGRGQPILLIHGLGGRATNWAPMIPGLAAQGYHVYAIDLLGYGDSDKPFDGDYTIAGEEKLALDFLHALHIEQADIAGWSMGGWVAMKLALDAPQAVRRLMVYDAAGLYFQTAFPLSLFAPADRAGLDALYRYIEPDRPHVRIPAFAVPGMLRRFHENQYVVDASFRSMLTGSDLLDFRVYRLKMPMLIVWGTEDHLIPVDTALRLHQSVPQSHLVTIRGCGHLAAAECVAQALPATLRFLAAEPPVQGGEEALDSGWR